MLLVTQPQVTYLALCDFADFLQHEVGMGIACTQSSRASLLKPGLVASVAYGDGWFGTGHHVVQPPGADVIENTEIFRITVLP